MKRFSLWMTVLFLACFCAGAQDSSLPKNTFSIMSYNVRNGTGLDNVTDHDRLSEVINRLKPDVIALQEIDSVTGRHNQKDVLREIAERTRMYRVYAPAIDYDGGKYGIGLLSKEKPIRSWTLPLPGREEKRVLQFVEFKAYIVANMHLSLTEEDRLASAGIIRKEAKKLNKPLLLAGDWNAAPGSSFLQEIEKDFVLLSDTSKATFRADNPRVCIDYIAINKKDREGFTLLSRMVVNDTIASDHRPVMVTLLRKAPKEKIFYTSPYLQNPVDNGITIMWQTTVPTYSWVEYGTDTLNLKRARTLVDGQVICNGLHNKIRINDLKPGQTYYYRVCSQEMTLYQAYNKQFGETAVSGFSTFRLPSPDDIDFTAIIFNDLHKQIPTMNALYDQVKDIPYDFVVFNGDCIDDPATEAEALRHMKVQCELVGANRVPVFYLRGNHEIRHAYSIGLRGLFDYVGDKTYGAFSWGDTRIVMLDCGEDKPDDHWVYYDLNDFEQLRKDQVDFLQSELASKEFKKASRRVLLNHIPLYGNGDSYRPCSDLWQPMLKKAAFDINISAHTHRFAYHPTGSKENNFPVVVGGSQRMETSTVMVLQKKGKIMTLRVLNTKGEVLLDLTL